MTQADSNSPDISVQTILPALAPESVAQLARLTRDCARLSEGHAGFSSLLGGIFMVLMALVEVIGHGWRFTWLGAWSSLPLLSAVGVALLAFAWLAARVGMRRWATNRFGLVVPALEPSSPGLVRREKFRILMGRYVIPGGMLLGLIPILNGPLSSRFIRADLLIALALVFHIAFPYLRGRLERAMGVLLFVAPTFLLSGIQMSVGDTILAYPLIGAAAVAMGVRDHIAFRKVRRELEAIQELA
jgi:hypothetical protein